MTYEYQKYVLNESIMKFLTTYDGSGPGGVAICVLSLYIALLARGLVSNSQHGQVNFDK